MSQQLSSAGDQNFSAYDLYRMDQRFHFAMRRAIASGGESAANIRPAKLRKHGAPTFFAPALTHSGARSPAAACAELGEQTII